MIEFCAVYIAIMHTVIVVALACINYNLKYYKPFDPMAPTNQYGEGLSEGIQNAIVRGQRGISTYE